MNWHSRMIGPQCSVQATTAMPMAWRYEQRPVLGVRDIESEILSKVESMNRELLRRVDEAAGIVQLTAVTE